MKKLRVALLQITSNGTNQDANLNKGDDYCRRAADMGADIALFPEMWNIGHTPTPNDNEGRKQWMEYAVDSNGSFVTHFKELVKNSVWLSLLPTWKRGIIHCATVFL